MAYLGEDIRKLGFGLMRLPKIGEEFDIEQIKKMVDAFLAAGFTYFDTAWIYPGSEEAIRKGLVERYPRESYQLATKMAAWAEQTREAAEAQLQTSLDRTGAQYFDFYLLHNLGKGHTQYFEDWDLWNFVKEKKEQGIIKHYGFSFHSTPEELDEILTAHPEAEFVQLQLNYADWDDVNVRARECHEVARKHNKPVIIMEPVKGGMLANPPQQVKDVLRAAEPDTTDASWAIRFAADLEGIITVLSGMSNMEQMEDNLKTMKDFTHLNPAEKETLEKAVAALKSVPMIQCTSCNYCAKGCPMDIGISGIFATRNHYTLYNNLKEAKNRLLYDVIKADKKVASECIECGACEDVCPQHLPIRDLLKEAAEVLE